MSPKAILFFVAVVMFASCGSSDAPQDVEALRQEGSKSVTSIQWLDSIRNFGNIIEGQKLALSFRFKNTGDKLLVIQSVEPACGCTVADYPKQPLKPGEEGEITGEFNSDGRVGQQHKQITVTTNTAARTHNVVFEVNVIAKPVKPANNQ